ncbi:neuronal acetylcholine receptor subunit alpha-7-like [Paramuricea clavata]|uniref:Neuronal acetylcholine receptor subunit alpha-7-like n=1 Tax=Paramuricea clavata TaxID=317549 RepID=A0A7D9IR21_PARCT|nr:neuronal acetylcholine receptor subunit alpha-7-like [Paramuricea clavata]
MVVFLLLVAEILPPNSEVTPMISIYCAGLMCEVGLALVASCFVLRLYCRHSGFDKMPSWIQTVVLDWLAKLTFTSSDVKKVREDNEEKAAKFLELFKTRKTPGSRNKARDGQLMESVYLLAPEWDSTYDLDTAGGAENDDVFTTVEEGEMAGGKGSGEPWSSHKSTSSCSHKKPSTVSGHSENAGNMELVVQGNKDCICSTLVDKLEHRQKTLVEHVSNMTSMLTDQEINTEKKKEWQLASRILDRSFLVFFVVGLIVSSLAIFMQIPHA